jgi:hypothetical protein
MDAVGRSQKADKPRKAKKKVRRGYGDQGDERPKNATDSALEHGPTGRGASTTAVVTRLS